MKRSRRNTLGTTDSDEHQQCLQLSSEPFALAVIFLSLFPMFAIAVSVLVVLECSKCGNTRRYELLTNLVSEQRTQSQTAKATV